ncbi:MAG: hypothetical protein AB7R89_13735 [Dehalococcoidia bacterium]
MDIHVFDITREDDVISETTKRDITAEEAFEQALEAARRAMFAAQEAEQRAKDARVACLRARPPGMTTTEVARRINRGR